MTVAKTPPDPTPEAVTVTESGDASATKAGVANSGIIVGDVRPEYHEHHHHPGAVPVWPVLVGQPPALASAFQPRQELRDRIVAARRAGDDVVLTQQPTTTTPAGGRTRVLAGMGGVGKSQLAAWFTHHALDHGTDLVVWVTARTPDAVITTYAEASARVAAPGADGTDPAADAAAFLQWLHTTDRTWLVVLDDITDPTHLAGWWPPHRPSGWTLATTRLHDATLASSGRRQVDVDVYTPAESEAYLTERLTDTGHAHLLDPTAAELAAAVGHLPLALSHATAYMITQEEGCTAYLARYTAGVEQLAGLMPASADPDDYGRPVAVTLLLALDAAQAAEPAGLARPALTLAALLDPDGHPDTLWTTPTVTDYLTAQRTAGPDQPVTADQARKALRLLHRYGLLTHTPTADARAVRIHALTARATRETTPTPPTAIHTTADALLGLWPDHDHATTDLLVALRANTTTLTGHAGDLLWQPDGHPLLYRAGHSLLNAGLHTPAVTHWQHLTDQAARLLGEEHLDTLVARASLAASYRQAGRTAEAIGLLERVAADSARLLGDDHPNTLTARNNLTLSYWQAGRTAEAITLGERVVADSARLLGNDHPNTLAARNNLANSYQRAGRTAEAIGLLERVAADSARLFGDDHPNTLTARGNLAHSYRQAGRTAEAITLGERVVADSAWLLGDEHPSTLTARANLASSYRQAGRTAEAITMLERVAADRARLLGEDHPDTVAAAGALRAWRGDTAP